MIMRDGHIVHIDLQWNPKYIEMLDHVTKKLKGLMTLDNPYEHMNMSGVAGRLISDILWLDYQGRRELEAEWAAEKRETNKPIYQAFTAEHEAYGTYSG